MLKHVHAHSKRQRICGGNKKKAKMKEMLKEQRDRLVKKKCTGESNKLKRMASERITQQVHQQQKLIFVQSRGHHSRVKKNP